MSSTPKQSFVAELLGLAFGEAHLWSPTGEAGSAPGQRDTRSVSPRTPLQDGAP